MPRIDLAFVPAPNREPVDLARVEYAPTPWHDYSGITDIEDSDPPREMWLRWMVGAHVLRQSGEPATAQRTWQWLVDNTNDAVGHRPQGNASAWAAAQAADAWRLTAPIGRKLTWREVQDELARRPDLLTSETVSFVLFNLKDRTWRALRDPERSHAGSNL